MSWIGLDIGGANLKAASSEGRTAIEPFSLWKHPAQLSAAVERLLNEIMVSRSISNSDRVAVTMTGELADCYPSRKLGVASIVDAVSDSCQRLNLAPPIFVGTDLQWRGSDDAKKHWLKTAASNWAAMATFSCRFLPQKSGFVVDMGSTTTDIIPVRDRGCDNRGKTDSQRLQHQELIYIGVGRTPVCSLVSSFNLSGQAIQGQTIPVAGEFFATIEDAMILAGVAAEDECDRNSADRRPKTKANCAARICRMICEDAADISAESIENFAAQILAAARSRISTALVHVKEASNVADAYLVSGAGEAFLFDIVSQQTTDKNIVRLSEQLSPELSTVAPAYAVAVLANEGSIS